MKPNKILHDEMLEVVENQIKANNPPETKLTYNRLVGPGISDLDAKKYIAQCVLMEISCVLKDGKPFNEERFAKNLRRLPEGPVE
jgi:hypothetical protein